jgi:hypothetical protein
VDGAHGPHEVLGVGVLEHEAARPAPQRPAHVVVDVEGGHDEDPHVRVRRGDPLGGREPVATGHAHVHEHDLGPQRRDRGLGRRAVPRLADDVDAAGGGEHRAEAGADDRLVVHEQHPDPHGPHRARNRG